jgi:gluconolactonase
VILEFDITGPGTVAPAPLAAVPGRFVTTWPNKTYLDSLAMEANGNIAQATLIESAGVTSIDPRTGAQEFFPFPDLLTTNVCFGGADMMDAWVTLSTTGKMAKCRWPRPGLRLNFNA